MTPPGLLGSNIALAERYDVALLDLDGVVYLGPNAIEGVPQALAQARARGIRLAFVTNNAARPPEDVAAHLVQLGIAAKAADVTTSAQAAAHYLAQRVPAGSRVLVVGTVGLVQALTERGLVPVRRDDDDVVAIVQGYSPDLTWRQLAQGAIAINRGAQWVATNLDPTVPSPVGPLPGNGSLVAALRHATGADPVSTGKPDPTMHRESVERSGAQRPIVVGDRLDTDIEGANAVGCPSLLVFSGVTAAADVLAAPVRQRPSYLAHDAGGLLLAHPQPTVSDGWAECGRWRVGPVTSADAGARATAHGSGLERVDRANTGQAKLLTLRLKDDVGGDMDCVADPATGSRAAGVTRSAQLDALRALCVATWHCGGTVRYSGADDPSRGVLKALGLD